MIDYRPLIDYCDYCTRYTFTHSVIDGVRKCHYCADIKHN